ncbi:putrescine carbamoyltransferase [Caulobacter sp. 1776]|uniref:putrescine carbamoyltransferase n=1 Tax=Caulobacter sp. 1776 TaxID=3156420 RepID=UPI003396EA08
MRHFIDTQDFSKAELVWLMDLIGLLKTADREGALPPLLAGASLGMIFEEPSTRTRISFEVAMTKLGGHALYLKPGEIHLGVRESIKDSARVISRMVDAIEARTLKHATVTELARYASVPVINGLTDYNHPTQVLCDLFTMREHRPPGKALEALKVAFIGDATNVCSSLMMICTQIGMEFVHCAPPRYQAPDAWQSVARANCAQSGGRFWTTDDPVAAVAGADFVYTDLWWWIGQEAEIPDRTAAFMPAYQITAALLDKASPHAKFMHCLPASRGVEVTDAVMDGPRSIIYDQAENRLHAEKAILVAFVRPHLKIPSARRSAQYAHALGAFLHDHRLAGAETPATQHED